MTYRIRPDRDLTGEVVRVATDQYRKAIDVLYKEPEGRHEAVHDARKRFKKLRGLFRLVREGAPDFYAAENARLRDTARSLSQVRDASALVETTDRLYGRPQPPDEMGSLLAVRHRLAARRDGLVASDTGLHERMSAAISACHDGLEALSQLALPEQPKKSGGIVARGLGKSYGRARAALKKAEESGEADDWHGVRKRVKYHWMHVRLLRPLWPGEMRLRAASAKRAGVLLGQDHDLAVLAALVDAEPDEIGDAAQIAVLRRAMDAESARLRGEFRVVARTLLADGRKLVRSRVGALWTDAA